MTQHGNARAAAAEQSGAAPAAGEPSLATPSSRAEPEDAPLTTDGDTAGEIPSMMEGVSRGDAGGDVVRDGWVLTATCTHVVLPLLLLALSTTTCRTIMAVEMSRTQLAARSGGGV